MEDRTIRTLALALALTLTLPAAAMAQEVPEATDWPTADELRRDLQGIGYEFAFDATSMVVSPEWSAEIPTVWRLTDPAVVDDAAPDDLDFEALRLQLIDVGEAPVQLMFAATSVDQAEGELETISSVLMEVASRLPAGAGLDAAVWYMNNVWQRGGGNAVTTLPCIVQEFDGGAMVVARLGDGESIESFSGVISHFDGTSPDVELCRQMQAQAEAAATDAGAAAAATGDTTDTVAETTGSTATVDYSVPPTEAVALINAGEHTIIDVRTPGEYEQAHVVGAINIDVEAPDFAERIAELDPDVPYLLYCRTGRRSNLAAQQMAAAGFTDLTDGRGLADLARAGAPVE